MVLGVHACRLQQKRAYSRSVAVSSIAGYIIGLGDRHSSNILLDSSTAEVVHIDLGVAFEGGKALRTPELVPFRLTRDMVDGLGADGVDGALRVCAEATLSVLRAAQQAVVTIVEVRLRVRVRLRCWNALVWFHCCTLFPAPASIRCAHKEHSVYAARTMEH